MLNTLGSFIEKLNGIFSQNYRPIFSAIGNVFKTAGTQSVKETGKALSSATGQVVEGSVLTVASTAAEVYSTITNPVYKPLEKIALGTVGVSYAGVGILSLIASHFTIAITGPVAAIVHSSVGLVKSSIDVVAALVKHQRYKNELDQITQNVHSLNTAIKFLKNNPGAKINFPSLIPDIKANILKLKEFGAEYNKLPVSFKENLTALEKTFAECSHDAKAYRDFSKLAKQSNKSISSLQKDIELAKKNIIENGSLSAISKKSLEAQYERLQNALNNAQEQLQSNPQDQDKILQNLNNTLQAETTIAKKNEEKLFESVKPDVLNRLTDVRNAQIHLQDVAETRIKQNKRNGWGSIAKTGISTVGLGLAIAGFFFPPLGIAITAVSLTAGVGFLGYTIYKKYQESKDKKALQKTIEPEVEKEVSKESEVTSALTNKKDNQAVVGMDHQGLNDTFAKLMSEETPNNSLPSADVLVANNNPTLLVKSNIPSISSSVNTTQSVATVSTESTHKSKFKAGG